jgi:hypothetical protein
LISIAFSSRAGKCFPIEPLRSPSERQVMRVDVRHHHRFTVKQTSMHFETGSGASRRATFHRGGARRDFS